MQVKKNTNSISVEDTHVRSLQVDRQYELKGSRFTSKKKIKLNDGLESQFRVEVSHSKKNSLMDNQTKNRGRNKIINRGSLGDLSILIL